MSPSSLIRWSGLCLMLGGLLVAAHLLSHPDTQVAGAHLARSRGWSLSHSLHFYGAVFVLLGVVGLYARQADRAGPLGVAGFVLALIGAGLYVGTGMITAYMWPLLGVEAPALTEAASPAFKMLIIPATGLFFGVGFLTLGIATMRAGVLPRWAGPLMGLGAVLFMLLPPQPIGPTPWWMLQVGGVLFAVGACWLGHAIWSTTPSRRLRAQPV